MVFVNGRVDPYSSVSLLPELLTQEQARLGIEALATLNGSHCSCMDASTSSDDPEAAAVKDRVAEAVGRWLQLQGGTASALSVETDGSTY